jgi:glycosyltransferase involved in cell wall biosynthesis
MKILVYALHYTKKNSKSGYIGGVWIRLKEILKRAKKFDLNYVLIEPLPELGDNYESIKTVNIKYHEKIFDTIIMILFSTIKGTIRAFKGDIDLILSPTGSLYEIIPAFITSLITRIPFTIIQHNVPVFHNLIELQPEKKFHPSLKGFYEAIRFYKHKTKPLYYAIVSTLWNYFIFKIKKTTIILGIGSGATYLKILDPKLKIKELIPANSIPSISIPPQENIIKKYDAIFLGSLKKEKGIFDAIISWTHLIKWNPSLKLAIIGTVRGSEILLKKIKSLIKINNLHNNIEILCDPMIGGSIETVQDTLAKSKIMLYPTMLDAWSFTIGEALSFGLPVVAYDIQAFKKSYPKCKALIRVPIGNIKQLCNEVRTLLENPKKIKSLNKEAKKYIEKYYTWDQVIEAEKNLYKKICFFY